MIKKAPTFYDHLTGIEVEGRKMAKVAQEMSIPLELYSNENTKKAIEKYFKNAKLMVSITKHLFEDWEDILVLAKNIRQDDLFVLVSARKGATSYIGSLENLP